MASRIPNARLAILPGESTAPYLGEMEIAAATVNEFLNTGTLSASAWPQPAAASAHPKRVAARRRNKSRPDGLTGREVEVLRLLAGGLTNQEIAKELVFERANDRAARCQHLGQHQGTPPRGRIGLRLNPRPYLVVASTADRFPPFPENWVFSRMNGQSACG